LTSVPVWRAIRKAEGMKIYVHQEGRAEAEVVEAGGEVVVAEALGIDGAEELLVLIEDGEEPLDLTITLEEAGVRDRGHVFRGRRHRVEATVAFNGEVRTHRFSTSAPVERVLKWAVGKQGFDLGKADAAEHTLALPDGPIPAADEHLGSLDDATPGHIRFDLVPKHRYQG
jgi:hypothetical protein